MIDVRILKCPCCGALAFADMDVCYECMHPLGRNPGKPVDATLAGEVPWQDVPAGKHVRRPGEAKATALSGSALDLLGDVYCYSIDSSLEAPSIAVENPVWSIEMSQPGAPDASVPVASSHPVVSIGRSLDNDLVIADLRVSRHHARIELADDALWARDLESRNLTYLDGVPLLGTKRLGDGSELRIGAARVHITRPSHPPASAPAS